MYLKTVLRTSSALALCAAATAAIADSHSPTITIATVNNADMITMQGLSDNFTEQTGINVEWVTLEENVLRQRVTTDITTGGGQFDVMMIGMYETPIWAANGWLVSLDGLPEEYQVDDLLPGVRAGLSYEGELYASPFYAESMFVHYRTDLMEAAGLEMPDEPTWEFIREAAAAMDDPENGINGICMRGKPGWGEGGALITVVANAFGARWFDEDWNAQFDQPEWAEALTFYSEMMEESGPDGYETNGFNENLSLFRQGLCGMWMDATVAAGWLTGEREGQPPSEVEGRVGWAVAPNAGLGVNSGSLWAWALAIPAGTEQADEATQFINWATSPAYQALIAENFGWDAVPPGTRTSLYENPEYNPPFADMTLAAIQAADPANPTVDPVPYVGIQFVAIPEFAGIATEVSQEFAAVYAGQQSVEEALERAQAITNEAMEAAGYQ